MRLILFRGRPATGKTTLSTILTAEIPAAVFRKDDMYDMVSQLTYSHELRNKVSFEIIYTILNNNVDNASTIILDCPFQYPDDIATLKKWCNENKVDLKSILVTCSDETIWAQRFKQRAENPTPNQLITDFDKIKERYPHLHLKPDDGELLIDTIDSAENNLKKILDFIK